MKVTVSRPEYGACTAGLRKVTSSARAAEIRVMSPLSTAGAKAPTSVDRVVDGEAEVVVDGLVAGHVDLAVVAASPQPGIEGPGGTADHGVGLDARVADHVDVVLLVVYAVGVGATEPPDLHPNPVVGVGHVDPHVVGETAELAPRRAPPEHHVEGLLDPVGGERRVERSDPTRDQLGVEPV